MKEWKSQLYNTIVCNYQIIAQAQLRRDLHYRDYRYSE